MFVQTKGSHEDALTRAQPDLVSSIVVQSRVIIFRALGWFRKLLFPVCILCCSFFLFRWLKVTLSQVGRLWGTGANVPLWHIWAQQYSKGQNSPTVKRTKHNFKKRYIWNLLYITINIYIYMLLSY